MEKTTTTALVFTLLSLLQGLYAVEVRPSTNPARVGENVTLVLTPQRKTESGMYLINGHPFLMWVNGNQTQVQRQLIGKVSINMSTGVLSLYSVTVSYSGVYELLSVSPDFKVNTTLTVLESVSDITVRANATDLVEFNDTVSLTCSASGTSLSFHWLNGSADIIVSQRVHLSSDNQTLTISNVLTSDAGPFYCTVSNAINKLKSSPFHLNISYGPENVKVTVKDSKSFLRGSNLTLTCSAVSSPPAQFMWAFNEKILKESGDELKLNNAQESQSGNYTCWAHNTITLRYSSSTIPITITGHSGSPSITAWLNSGLLLGLLVTTAPLWFPH